MIFESFLSMLKNYNMLKNTQIVVLGLSGGADSVALTHLFNSISKEKAFDIIAVHLNHGIRPFESQRDEDFVKQFCKDMNIKLIVKNADILSVAKDLKIGIEEAGRKVRYEIFQEIASKWTNSKIATAHTLSDNAETVLMRLVSGTSLKGLCGIPPVRGNIIRPLLGVQRLEIEEYCRRNNLNYMIDSSNLQKSYTRNKIRLELIPLLKNINPSFEHSIERAIRTFRADATYLEEKSNKIFNQILLKEGFDVSNIRNLPDALKHRILFKIIEYYTAKRVDQKHLNQLDRLIEGKTKRICIPGCKTLIYNNGKLTCEKKVCKNNSEWEYRIRHLNILTEIQTTIIINVVSISEYKSQLENKNLKNLWAIDADKLPFESVFRNRRPKDMFTFSSRGVSKSVKKIFNEMKIPLDQRYKIPVLAYKNDVIWIDRIGVSRNYLPTKNTKMVAIIKE